ncbi:ABC transporter substrate-binding protein [Schaalia suimastitidis]|uniref:ABC transporter substrate-binding protein n=1 Tax=Schaalia suimastitidis TaxID=121163 RepID=UPI0003FD0D62|nr:ABC transporter substrate-binding protein [Schaalia suimastitidis]
MKRPLVALAVTTTALSLAACSSTASQNTTDDASSQTTYRIGISQIVSHTALDSAREGFKSAFDEAGLAVEWVEENAQGDQGTATAIAATFAASDLDLVLAIATPTAQAAANTIADIPVLFTAVTDPVSAQLVDSLEAPGGNVTGTTDMNPVAEQIGLIKKFAPDATTVGILYSSGEINSKVQVNLAKAAAEAEGLTVKEATVTNSGEVQQAAQSLSDVDAFYVPTDNTVVSAIAAVVQVAETEGIPIIAGEGNTVTSGALATYGVDYAALGKQTAQMAIRILTEGADPATMPVEEQDVFELIINKTAAEAIGITIPDDLAQEATIIE